MEITGNSINQPVNFYPKNTGNTINMAINDENTQYITNVFTGERKVKESKKSNIEKKRKKNNRLNTIDSEYIGEETADEVKPEDTNGNFFIEQKEQNSAKKIAKEVKNVIKSVPLINYFILKEQTKKIGQKVEELNDITQEVEDIINGVIPYGEESGLYSEMADKLRAGATILKETNREIKGI